MNEVRNSPIVIYLIFMCVKNKVMLTCYRYILLGKLFWVQNDRSLLAAKVDVEEKSTI